MIARLLAPFSPSRRHSRRLFIFLSALAATVALHGQGALFPPSDPAPTMKTLDQVEPRTIVNASNTPGDETSTFIITAAGSYYLTGNIAGTSDKHGISIRASDVTLDLNGFALVGIPGLAGSNVGNSGIVTSGTPLPTNICIRNGSIRGWGDAVLATSAGTLAEKLMLHGNVTGLTVGNGSIVRDCVATANENTGFVCVDRTQISNCISTENAGNGIQCTNFVTVIDCTASRNGYWGIIAEVGHSTIVRCTVSRNGFAGILAGTGSTVAECTVANNSKEGIDANTGTTIRNCTLHGNTKSGIFVSERCHVVGNTCDANGIGIHANSGGNRIEGNSCSANDTGYSLGPRNLFVRNSAHANGTNYSGVGGIGSGPIVDLTVGGALTTESPWANFVY